MLSSSHNYEHHFFVLVSIWLMHQQHTVDDIDNETQACQSPTASSFIRVSLPTACCTSLLSHIIVVSDILAQRKVLSKYAEKGGS